MEKRIIFKKPDGSIGVLIPSIKWDGELDDLASKDVPAGLPWRITELDNIPTDRTYRDAWTDSYPTETVDVDLSIAKDIQKMRIREARKPLLEILDIEYQRADETSDTDLKNAIFAKKQNLRDFTKRVDTATNLDALKEILPNEAAL